MIFLGIDCGTQSTKTIALDWESGEILSSAQKAYGFVPNLPPGAMEQDPNDWIEAAEQSIGEVIAKLGALKDEVRGIGVSGQQHGLVVLDQEGRVVRPAKLWNDTTTSSQCDQITDHFGGSASVIALVGNTIRTGYTAPKILWLRQNEPENWKMTRSILLPHDYLNFWLTGAKKMEFGDASGTALLDVKTRQWSMKLVDYIADDLSKKLPLLISSKLPSGTLREELCMKWGLTKAPSVSAGGGDNMMAAMDSRASANSVCIAPKSVLPEAEVIAGYGAKCARTFSACRQCVSEAEKGPGSAGPFRRDGFGTMNKDRVPRCRKFASDSYRQTRPRATSLMPMQARYTPTL